MYTLAVALPDDMTELNKKYNEVMVEVTKRLLTQREIEHLINIWDERNKNKLSSNKFMKCNSINKLLKIFEGE